MNVGDLIVKIGADISDFQAKMQQTDSAVQGFGSSTLGMSMRVGTALAATAAVIGTVARESLAMAEAAGRAAEQLQIVSAQTGVSTQALQGYDVLLNRNKLGIDDLAASFRLLSHSVKEAEDPNSKAALRFRELGISLDGDHSPERLLEQLADQLSSMPDGFQKTALATEVLGRSGMRLLPVLSQGSEALKKAREDAQRLGTALSDEAVAKAAKFDDAMDDLRAAMEGFSKQTGALVAGPMTFFVEKITDMIGAVNNLAKAAQEGKFFEMLGAALSTQPLPGPQPGQQKTVKAPNAAEQAGMAEALDIVDPAMVARSTTSLDGLLQKIRLMSEDYKGMAIVAHTSMVDAADAAAKLAAQHQLGEEITAKLIARYKDMSVQDAKFMEIEEDRQNVIDRGLAGEQFHANLRNNQVYATKALMELLPNLTGMEANLQAIHNQEKADDVVEQERLRHQAAVDNIAIMQREIDVETTQMNLQHEFYTSAPGLIGQAQAARTQAFKVFELEERQRVALLEEGRRRGELTEMQFHDKIIALDMDMQAKRMAAIRQYPTFFEQQMQAVVQSNAFSMASITNQATGAFARWVVEGTKFKSFWISLQESLVQAAMQSLVQMLANVALAMVREAGMYTAMEQAKSSIAEAMSAERAGVQKTEQELGVANAEAALGQIAALANAGSVLMTATMEGIGVVFDAIAAALDMTVYGAVLSTGFWEAGAAVAAAAPEAGMAMEGVIGGALAEAEALIQGTGSGGLGIPAMAGGGIVTGPTLALVGEAGPEAVIPLDRLHDSGGSAGPLTVIVELDGHAIARNTMARMPRLVRVKSLSRT